MKRECCTCAISEESSPKPCCLSFIQMKNTGAKVRIIALFLPSVVKPTEGVKSSRRSVCELSVFLSSWPLAAFSAAIVSTIVTDALLGLLS